MEITNDYLVALAEREMDAIHEIASPLSAFSRIFSREKQQEAVEKALCHKERCELILEIQKYLNT